MQAGDLNTSQTSSLLEVIFSSFASNPYAQRPKKHSINFVGFGDIMSGKDEKRHESEEQETVHNKLKQRCPVLGQDHRC